MFLGEDIGLDQADKLRAMKSKQQQDSHPRIISITSGKGGVGKTNIAVNLACSFAVKGLRTLLIDGDFGLANTNILLGLKVTSTIEDVLFKNQPIQSIFHTTAFGFETTAVINRNFPHWFCGNFKQYSQNPAAMPFDAHMLLALTAPRPLYVASAEEDRWADPHGEFLAAQAAGPVYALFGKEGLGVDTMPAVNEPVGQTIGYHIRTGKHDVTEFDWAQYLNFADRHLRP